MYEPKEEWSKVIEFANLIKINQNKDESMKSFSKEKVWM